MAYRNHRNAASRPSIYQTVTDRIISSLKSGVIPWERPWKSPRYAGGPFPRNFYTGRPYRGVNVLLLWSSEYNSPFWLTFRQAQALKGSVRKGEHGTPIVFYKQLPEHVTKDEETTSEDERAPFVLCHYAVFNVEQCDGLTLPAVSQPASRRRSEKANSVRALSPDGRIAPLSISTARASIALATGPLPIPCTCLHVAGLWMRRIITAPYSMS
jgi:antirestriction protein ArdC